MMPHLQGALVVLLLLTAQSQADEKFPQLKEIEVEFYQTDVQVTDLTQGVTAFASEYYDESSGYARSRVNVVALGNRLSVFYYNETNEILELNSTHCMVWDTDESIFDYQPIFYGWLTKNPLVIGPTAPIWYAIYNPENITYGGGDFVIRDIKCDRFSVPYSTKRDNVTFNIYFANKDWTTPYMLKGMRVPIRIEAVGYTSRNAASADQAYEVNQYTDFAYFRPDIADWRIFESPEGFGCPLRKQTKEMPKMPRVYRYSAEMVDLLKAEDNEISDIEFQQVWYDGVQQLARLDKYTKLRFTSELYDFNTGVTYSSVDDRTCDIKALRNSFFEGYDGQMIGHLKEPGEVLGLDNKFYYLGKKFIRNIECDVFESAKLDVTFMKQDLQKLVITVYYSKEYYEFNIDGEAETRIPVFYAVKGYDEKHKLVINLQYNIFGFDDVIYPELYSSFRLGRCFPSMKDKSYFIMIFSEVGEKLARKMEGQDDFIKEELRMQISNAAKVSHLRIPFMKVDYKTTGVYVTALMVDRPPALKQFWLENQGKDMSTNDPNLKVSPAADTLEKCAFSCVDETSFNCTGFFFCNKACFIKSKDILEPNDKDVPDFNFGGDMCDEWLRSERNSNNYEAYLVDALKDLENAVLNDTVKVMVKYDEAAAEAKVSDIIIGEGPYIGEGNQEKPYDLVINFAKLDPNDETTEQMHYIDSLNDCYLACKKSGDLSCSSFSYCPEANNKQCSISSVLVVDRKTNPDDTVDDKNCYVYSMKFLDFYDPYPGRVALVPGDDVIKGVKSVEECAKNCRQSKDFMCRGFEYCQGMSTCVLHSKHVLDLKPGDMINKKSTCIHYAARFTADYLDMGLTLLDDSNDVRGMLSLEQCARICSEELKDKCKSFNYCPATSEYSGDSTCALTSLTLTSPKITTTTKPPCHHYEKKSAVDDWGSDSKPGFNPKGYTTGGFTWLVISMLALGLALGAVGFIAYSYYKSRSSMDQATTVRYMKS